MKPAAGKVFSVLNLHLLVLGLLAALNLFFCVRLIGAWHTLHASGREQVEDIQSSYRVLDLQTRPLRDLPQKVEQAGTQADAFYDQRFPAAYSSIDSAIYDLSAKSDVRLTHLSYVQAPAIADLAEIRMDANLSGQYAPLMHFINGLERSQIFFVINDVTFTGQQGGLVNLRLRLTTYMRASNLDQTSPPANEQAGAVAGANAAAGSGSSAPEESASNASQEGNH